VLEPGTTVSRYVVESLIGEGGMGAVYRARDTHLDRPVALKVISASSTGGAGFLDHEARERMVREARAAAALSHPNAVAIHDAGDSDHGPFIVMELVEGQMLRAAVADGASLDDVVGWIRMACLALGEAHGRGIVHRDIKPENLMVRRDGILKVLDFGIARQGAASPGGSESPTHANLPTITNTGIQIGTPQYMAPEQIKGKKLDGRADQFSLAVTAYEALAGRSPWQAENGALGIVASILQETPDDLSSLRPEVPAHVSAAIARAMEKKPEDRFKSMLSFSRALAGEDVDSAEPTPKLAFSHGGRAPITSSQRQSDAPAGVAPKVVSSPPAETRFGEGTMKLVIDRALALEEQQSGGYSKSEVAAAAAEIGISEAAFREAAEALRAEKRALLQAGMARTVPVAGLATARSGEESLRERIIRRRRRAFLNHLIAYIGVNLIIVSPMFLKDMSGKIWALFIPAIGWGIGLAIHFLNAFSKEVDDEEIRRAIARDERSIARDAARRASLATRLERQAKRNKMKQDAHKIGEALEHGVASVLDAAAQRIRAGGEAEKRIRVEAKKTPKGSNAPSTEREIRAEVEAELEAEAAAEAADRRVRRS